MKNIIFLSALLLTAQFVSAHHDDQDYVCEDQLIITSYFEGYASCHAVDSNGFTRYLSEYVLRTTSPTVTLSVIPGNYGSGSCSASVPYSHSESRTVQSCQHIPREPYVNYVSYEYNNCSINTRNGFITWQNKPQASTYELEEKVGGNWVELYSGSHIGVNYTKSAPYKNETYSLRVRAKNSSETGSWRYFSALVPKCSGGAVQPK